MDLLEFAIADKLNNPEMKQKVRKAAMLGDSAYPRFALPASRLVISGKSYQRAYQQII